MISRPKEPFLSKRWVYGLSKLELEPFKYPDEESKNYERETPDVGNLTPPNIIVSEEIHDPVSQKTTRRYALFENYVQVYKFCNHVRTEGRTPHLYEVCPYYMKIHFDIDVKMEDGTETMFEGDNRYYYILRPCLRSIDEVFSKLFPAHYNSEDFVDNILVFEAHRSSKISFHVVVDGFFLACHEAHYFYKLVTDNMAENGFIAQSSMVDFSVYKKNQAFRMFGSNKAAMSGREGVKTVYAGPPIHLSSTGSVERVFSRERMYTSSFKNECREDEALRNLRILERSLISNTLGNTKLFISVKKQAERLSPSVSSISPSYRSSEIVSMTKEELEKVINVFFQHTCSKTERGDTAFSYMKYIARGGYICLKRIKESYCPICKKNHEAENAFLFRNPDGDVNYVCRRAQESKKGSSYMYIGQALFDS
jgi:hypothetical protein